ncbi:MAG TPA: TIGR03668 family PPOX class F420-dependent oxidoreductase [Acidimicrobiales bacterium]|nr:TIGR03668 family PPOX class F420-dependent oxidoreductase [Acidimicrobiales bacterium]
MSVYPATFGAAPLADARVGHLATVTADNRPHIVPCCFVLADDTVYSAVDAKPKSTLNLRRLQNVRVNGSISLLVDHYEDDWAHLWWVRVDGGGRVLDEGAERERALGLLAAKYGQYRDTPAPGPVLALDIEHWRTWP